ncbi:hypothetical protein JWG42_17450, partial [Desulfoprunum benzoelyticum]|uniref:hypothetical protein n=1 Tax=Desulfoprunum benzoelyticum TaxID=1506996 RepID=UPI001963E82A
RVVNKKTRPTPPRLFATTRASFNTSRHPKTAANYCISWTMSRSIFKKDRGKTEKMKDEKMFTSKNTADPVR